MHLINQTGCSVFLNIDPNVLVDRLSKTDFSVRPLISEHEEDLEQYLDRLLEIRSPFYNQAKIIWEGTAAHKELFVKLSSING